MRLGDHRHRRLRVLQCVQCARRDPRRERRHTLSHHLHRPVRSHGHRHGADVGCPGLPHHIHATPHRKPLPGSPPGPRPRTGAARGPGLDRRRLGVPGNLLGITPWTWWRFPGGGNHGFQKSGMVASARVGEIFADARVLYIDALDMLEQGRLRNASEKAWGATKRATDALILARTEQEPRSAGQTRRSIRALGRDDAAVDGLARRYSQRQTDLHGACFYDGDCEPEDRVIQDIHATGDYIRDAEQLA